MDIASGNGTPRGVKRKAEGDVSADSSVPRRIQALDPNVVNKIAAGEIIIAPVHALKELVENAVDAGSTMLEVLVKDGGLKLLQITDNGCGIDKQDLPILCERFTTSKLQKFEDLESIATYGFRGEALASISHIAHLTVTTRTKDSESAWRAYYEAGKLASPKPGQGTEPKRVAGRQGTQITVEDLFYNVPTRRRAFRSTSDEYNKIVDMLGRYAVHCSHVAFACKKHGESSASISVQAAASTVDRIRHVYGGAVASELLPFETDDSRWGFKARGWATNANFSMKRTTLLLFINGRSVDSTNIRKALDETYSAYLPKNSHPFVYLSLEIDPQRVDVNVHPTKREVNFLNEDEISRAICEHISSKLAEVDTSRTFSTQTLLPTAGSRSINNGDARSVAPTPKSGTSQAAAPKKTPARLYENNLVRTDTNMRKITSMFGPSGPTVVHMSPSTPGSSVRSGAEGADGDGLPPGVAQYEVVDREATVNWLKSVRELKEAVVENSHSELTEIFKSYSFVGIVDERRRLAAIQSGVKLYLVDYGRACFELFYQIGLNDFGNFGVIRFSPPLDLRQLLRLAFQHEHGKYGDGGDDDDDGDDPDPDHPDADEAVEAVATQLIERRQMLQEYFSLEVTPTGELLSIPLLIKGYTPPLAKLPQFLLRLGPRVRWNDEKGCFDTLLKELASFYVPEKLPIINKERQRHQQQQALKKGKGKEETQHSEDGDDDDNDNGIDDDTRARRLHVQHAVEHVFFPAFKTRLICTTTLMQAGLIEVANLKGLYRVFERC
ncbi:DNA mismatch repair protein MLH1 [Sporothrix brasiliensis 5110]|uniref:DNA mismatch repair protein MLH1 n=1 Tax=Sporothrix brasiliensis 5110 TaxID=1398154 RepID=A0A0C2FGH1_9PEZI|nr:DNA mismatch repair protein MLH1 [Sporothrix brasiliensis 5110]KIH90128.1 DNA mismatch repair protein MLH1 [Sporothrix brasiliensis 5110]